MENRIISQKVIEYYSKTFHVKVIHALDYSLYMEASGLSGFQTASLELKDVFVLMFYPPSIFR